MSETSAVITFNSPVGPLTVRETEGAIASVHFGAAKEQRETALLAAAKVQLDAYFYCGLKTFELPLAPVGSEFNRRVWEALAAIPYGHILSYGEVASRTGGDARAVGGACGANPIPIIIPCHRVLGQGGTMVGYSGGGGTETKRFLLQLEGAILI
jgi:methylated-DNA-[protein]-cysteine S-methyltransferase